MNVGSILKSKGRGVVYIKPDQPIGEALAKLEFEDVGALVVSKRGRKVDGIISERDVVRGLRYYGAEIFDRTVSDLMTVDVVTCEASAQLAEAMKLMKDNAVRHLPVLKGGLLIGVISIRDLLSEETPGGIERPQPISVVRHSRIEGHVVH